ncbi:MAG: hypothetical protein V4472_20950 [Pseudomonadota bacterium]
MSAAPARVLIRGGGVSAATAARLLSGEGVPLTGAGDLVRSPAPVIMLSDPALALLRDIFGRADLFAGRPRIERRIVAWGGGEPVAPPHGAIIVTGSDIAAELGTHRLPPDDGKASFTINGAPPFPDGALRRFGAREAVAATVELMPEADGHACYIEATARGWLFLIPQGVGTAWLLGVGGTPDALLGPSRLVAAQVRKLGPVVARFETAPRMIECLAGDDWIACGTSAIAFDPICGDGTAQAAREAILAAAVLVAIRDGGDRKALLDHYQSMLIAAMRRHLQVSLPFYRSGGISPWWRAQADALAQGHAWCTARLATMPEPRFLLRGTRLVPRDEAA